MAPKKKVNKKGGGDDWESELGENFNSALADNLGPTDEEAAPAASHDEAEGGGLLAALKKNRGKKAKKGKVVEDIIDVETPLTNGVSGKAMEDKADIHAKAPEEANMDDENLFDMPGKKSKGGKNAKVEAETGVQEAEDEAGFSLKSKKEKEKEKREREKQRKKEQAAKKKPPTSAPSVKEAHIQAATSATEAVVEVVSTVETATSKKKKLPPQLAALQKQQEELKKRQEEEARAAAEEKLRVEEQERLAAEDAQKKAEARAIKKQKEKEKVEQLKKEGKFMTKAQKEAQAQAKLRMQQMIDSGAKVTGLQEPVDKKKPVYDNKRKKGPKKNEIDAKHEEDEAAKILETQRKVEELKLANDYNEAANSKRENSTTDEPVLESDENDGLGDWEVQADSEHVKESWDAESDDEESRSVSVPADVLGDGKTTLHGMKSTKSINAKVVSNSGSKGLDDDGGDDDNDDDEAVEEEESSVAQREAARKKQEAAERREKRHEEAMAARSKDNLRSPICCILGHVDTGKTKLLDKIRQTNVQEGEAGGITQQIGATYFPVEALKKKTQVVNKDGSFEFKVPGLLVIDTPGHESFTNLRSRGSSLCNIAILVVDIMHGLEQQTLESMKLLRDRKTPFIVALNKIDRLYGWKKIDNNGFQDSLSLQNKAVQSEFEKRLASAKLQFAEQGFNSELFYENKSMARNVSIVPTSAHTGEGIPDMLKLIVNLTQERMTNKLMYLSEVECTVLEVKIIEGLGTTIDVVLSNGILREGDRIVLCGLNGPIATNVRALLTPAEMKELRVKSAYVHNKEVKASLGVKIAANDLENAIAGSRLLVVGEDDDEEDLEEQVMSDLENLLGRISKTGRGVSVQASTLGSLEALLEFLKVSKIPVANISIGPVFKRDVMSAGIMLEKAKEYAVMLCFDVKVDKEAQAYADEVGVKIFTADIIYHLFDAFTLHMAKLAEQRKEESKLHAVFPCILETVGVFHQKDPIVIGVDVKEGNLRPLTPIATVKTNPITGVKEIISLGRVQSIEREHKQIPLCKKGQPAVAVKIEGPNQPMYGRQLEEKDPLYSMISRTSIDTLKEFYRSDVSNEEWALIKKLKPLFDIP